MKPKFTQEFLKKYLSYNPLTGIFTKKTQAPNSNIGDVAGGKQGKGYLVLCVGGNPGYLLHRVAWLYVYGYWPKSQIDHINRVVTDNRISNLREATRTENYQNKGAQKNSKTGVKGVSLRNGRYVVQICDDGVRKHLGQFGDIKTAAKRYADEVAIRRPIFGAVA